MRISDWSSDVCSSDLKPLMIRSCCCSSSDALVTDIPGSDAGMYSSVPSLRVGMNSLPKRDAGHRLANRTTSAIDRKSAGKGKSVAVRVDRGGRRRIKKKKNECRFVNQYNT